MGNQIRSIRSHQRGYHHPVCGFDSSTGFLTCFVQVVASSLFLLVSLKLPNLDPYLVGGVYSSTLPGMLAGIFWYGWLNHQPHPNGLSSTAQLAFFRFSDVLPVASCCILSDFRFLTLLQNAGSIVLSHAVRNEMWWFAQMRTWREGWRVWCDEPWVRELVRSELVKDSAWLWRNYPSLVYQSMQNQRMYEEETLENVLDTRSITYTDHGS